MMLLLLLLLPVVAAVGAYFTTHDGARRTVLVMSAAAHATMVTATWAVTPAPLLGGWVRLDALGQLFLSVTSALFLLVAIHSVGYLQRESRGARRDI
ncbi:MAG TPA: NADH dehydrogenase FAD-containing subunit, partial [Candidatus Kryptonia bacterium]|nr:NADH dehydrogenase FAD-containing subunit [Candidatus Kryptonia bacterium]